MNDEGLAQVIEQDHQALLAICNGDPEPKKQLYSRRDDATLANPLGPPARGWEQVSAALEGAASVLRDGEPGRFERISGFETPDLAYILEIERTMVKLGGATEPVDVALRVTTVFRREDDTWKIVHRHADPIITRRPIESLAQ